jgi:hypothetical protein
VLRQLREVQNRQAMRDKFWELTDKTRLGSLLKINKENDKLENSNTPGLGK